MKVRTYSIKKYDFVVPALTPTITLSYITLWEKVWCECILTQFMSCLWSTQQTCKTLPNRRPTQNTLLNAWYARIPRISSFTRYNVSSMHCVSMRRTSGHSSFILGPRPLGTVLVEAAVHVGRQRCVDPLRVRQVEVRHQLDKLRHKRREPDSLYETGHNHTKNEVMEHKTHRKTKSSAHYG